MLEHICKVGFGATVDTAGSAQVSKDGRFVPVAPTFAEKYDLDFVRERDRYQG